jgi:hypothetical protein
MSSDGRASVDSRRRCPFSCFLLAFLFVEQRKEEGEEKKKKSGER